MHTTTQQSRLSAYHRSHRCARFVEFALPRACLGLEHTHTRLERLYLRRQRVRLLRRARLRRMRRTNFIEVRHGARSELPVCGIGRGLRRFDLALHVLQLRVRRVGMLLPRKVALLEARKLGFTLLERRVQLGGALLFRTQLNAELQQHSRSTQRRIAQPQPFR